MFKKHPEIFNSSYLKKYHKYKKLLYISFLKNKGVIYNYDKNSNTYNTSNEHKSLFDENNFNDLEEREFLNFLKENFIKMQNNNSIINNNMNNSRLIDIINNVENDKNEINSCENFNKNQNNNYAKIEIPYNNNNNINDEETNLVFSSNNNSNIIYDHNDKIKLQNKYLVNKNKFKQFTKKKLMQTVNLNDNLVNNLNFEISKINQNKTFARIYESSYDKRPNSHNLYSLRKNNIINNKNNNYSINKNISENYNENNNFDSILKKKVYKENSSNSPNLIDDLKDNLKVEIFNSLEKGVNLLGKQNTEKTLLNQAAYNSENDNCNNNRLKEYKINSNKLIKDNKADIASKSRETGSNTNSIDIKNIQNYTKPNAKDNFKVLLDENIKLAKDEKDNRNEVNLINFHSDISTDRYGLFAKIEQKDFKDNFIRLKDNLEYNTIQNRILVSHRNHKFFTKNFFRKNNNENKDYESIKNDIDYNNELNKNQYNINLIKNNEKENKILKTETNITKNCNIQSTDNKQDLLAKASNDYTKEDKIEERIINQNKLYENYHINDCYQNNKIENLNKDFRPVSRMLNTNYSWGDKLNYLKTPTSVYHSTKEGLRTHCSVNNNEFLQNYFKVYQKTNENQLKKVIGKNNYSSEKYLLSLNSNFRDKYFNSKEKKEILGDAEHKNLYSENNLKKAENDTKLKVIEGEFINEKELFTKKSESLEKSKKNHYDNEHNKNEKFDSSSKGLIKLQEDAILNKNDNKANLKTRITLKGFPDSKTFGNEKNTNSNYNIYNSISNNFDNNSVSINNTQIEKINSKKSFNSNSKMQNNHYNLNALKQAKIEGPQMSKHKDSILNNSINLNDLYEKYDLKQSIKITSQNGKKSKVLCLEHQKAEEEILRNSHIKNPILPKKNNKIHLYKELIKTPPLPSALENFNQNIKTRKTSGLSVSNTALNFYKNSRNKNNKDNINSGNKNSWNNNINDFEKISYVDQENIKLRNELSNRYRKKKINIEDVLILHNTNIRKQLNPVKIQEFHMKCSVHRKDKFFGLKRTSKQNCFNKSETYQLARENLIKFEKPI